MRDRVVTVSPVHPAKLSGATLRAMITYGQSAPGLDTARNIIDRKIRNCRCLLTNYRQSRQRVSANSQYHLKEIQQHLQELRENAAHAETVRELFLIEARAATWYWRAVKLLCQQVSTWQRIYPTATDPVNVLLNVGYTILARECRTAILAAGLLPQLGILHSENAREPLVYDIAEIFRQPVVDAVIIPLFSRKQASYSRLPKRDMRRGFTHLHNRLHERVLYHGRCEQLRTIVHREVIGLRTAIEQHTVWKPYRHPWRHDTTCSQEQKKTSQSV